jgi:hypothetical protein
VYYENAPDKAALRHGVLNVATRTPGVNSGGPEKFAVPASLVVPVMLLLNNTKHDTED